VSNRKKIVKAVIPAAGFGTRMLPATKVVPKEMLPVAGKPLIQHAIEEAAASGIETVVVVVRELKSLIQKHFARDHELDSFLNDRGMSTSANLLRDLAKIAKLQFVQQRRPLGLADAVLSARPFVGDDPFVVLLPDVIMVSREPVVRQLIGAHEETGGSVLAIREVEPQDVQRFGIVRVARSGTGSTKSSVRISGLVEKPSPERAPSRLGVFGRYLLEPSIWDAIAQTNPDPSGEVQLTDALNLLCQNELLFGVCFEGRHYDAGDRIGYLQANIELSLEDPRLREPLLNYLSGITCVNS
jgi:UTP--glucose-1-phosphate uridylyltransferase